LYSVTSIPWSRRRLTVASRPFLADPPAGFSAVPLLHPRGALSIGRSDQLDRVVGLHAAGSMLVTDLQLVDTDRVRQLCPVLAGDYVAAGVWEPRAADIDVDALLGGYRRRLGRAGGRLVTASPVRSVHRRAGRYVLDGAGVGVEARVVVNAAGAWADAVAELCGARPLGLVPYRRTAFIFDPPGTENPRVWPMVIDVDETFSFKPEGGRRRRTLLAGRAGGLRHTDRAGPGRGHRRPGAHRRPASNLDGRRAPGR
jgi:D-arginine dehydrogenase